MDDSLVEALEETIELMQEEISRYRDTNRRLRKVIRTLRRQVSIAAANDERFKELCESTDVADEDVDYV